MEERFMRVLVMFDMPTYTKDDRKAASKFRNDLIKEGFFMMQFSVYVRICKGVQSANTCMKRLEMLIPKKGHIRALMLTERQFDNMKILIGTSSPTEKAQKPEGLLLF